MITVSAPQPGRYRQHPESSAAASKAGMAEHLEVAARAELLVD